jgi:iron complex outermembrane receptor protein
MKRHLMLGGAFCALLLAAPHLALAAEAAASPPADAAPAEANEVDAVIVLGQGQSRQVQTINTTQIEVLAAGSSPLRAIEKLPGVSFQSADAFGAYEWSTRVAIRGFDQGRLGFTLDGVPLGDMNYGNYNGLHVSRAVTSEDLGRVELAQGAGALSVASTSNLGGTLQFFTRDPSQDFHVQTNATVGSDSMYRVFGRVDTGAIEPAGRPARLRLGRRPEGRQVEGRQRAEAAPVRRQGHSAPGRDRLADRVLEPLRAPRAGLPGHVVRHDQAPGPRLGQLPA